jgi:hypothetical protein
MVDAGSDARNESSADAPEACPADEQNPISNADAAAGAVYPIPTGLWRPPTSFAPPAGTYVYLKSDSGDYIGQGRTFTYQQIDSVLTFAAASRLLAVTVEGDEYWTGEFQPVNGPERLQVGYYPDLTRAASDASSRGTLNWFGQGRSCEQSQGWLAVDSVTYVCGVLTDIVLRFEQRCDGEASALHGQVHWSAADSTQPPGPVMPPPNTLWRPAPGATPASGTYVYLVSDSGDRIGQGQTRTYTEASATFAFGGSGAHLELTVANDFEYWIGDFQPMMRMSRLEPGYYGNVRRWPFHNPARGGFSWFGNGAECAELTGWFAVDAVSYKDEAVQALELRFEQHCEGATAALRGQVHIVRP